MIISFSLNGAAVEIDALPHRRAAALLRDELNCRSLRMSCEEGRCGTCLILLDKQAVYSCILPVFELRFTEVWTMEGLAVQKGFADIVAGYKEARMRPCWQCAPARALATEALLRHNLRPGGKLIQETAQSVRCGCCSTQHFREAIFQSARLRENRET